MSTKPVPLLQQLRNLVETKVEAHGLRFMVDTADGLRLLPLNEVLSLSLKGDAVVKESTVIEKIIDEDSLKNIREQLTAQQLSLEELKGAFGDLGIDVFEYRMIALRDKPEKFQPDESVSIGLGALSNGAVDRENIAIGMDAGTGLDGTGNVLIGTRCGFEPEGEFNEVTAIGHQAAIGCSGDLNNVTLVGAHARPTGNHQVILGDYRTTTQFHAAPHRRSDIRDMRQPKPIELGLDFVLNIQPIQYFEDFREAYVDWTTKPSEPTGPREAPTPPAVGKDDPNYQPQLIAYLADKAQWNREIEQYEMDLVQYHVSLQQWIFDNKLARISTTGEHQGNKVHYGFNVNQIQRELNRLGLDAGLVKDHSEDGGESVKTQADVELIPILWRAVQQLSAIINSRQFIDSIASALHQKQVEGFSASLDDTAKDVVISPEG